MEGPVYAVDADHVLHKFETATLRETMRLKIEGTVNDIAFSQEGMLLAISDREVIRVVDPQSLATTREIVTGPVRCVAALPATVIAYASAGDSELLRLDLKAGTVLQRTDMRDTAFSLLFGGPGASFSALCTSPDGKYLFAFHWGIFRLRVEGSDLVLEEGTTHLQDSVGKNKLCVCNDGKIIYRVGGKGGVFHPDFLLLPLRREAEAWCYGTGVDNKTGEIYVIVEGGVAVSGPDGGSQEKLKLRPLMLVMDPRGERFLSIGPDSISYVDAKPERLEATVAK